MWHLIKRFQKSTRFLRYRYGRYFSKRQAFRLKMIMEKEKFCSEGYAYDYLKKCWVIQSTDSVYIPIFKSANTTIKHLISMHKPSNDLLLKIKHNKRYINYRKKYPGDFNFDDESMLIHAYTPPGIKLLDDYGLTPGDLTLGIKRCFTIVRHPVDRFLSAYRDKIASPGNTSLKNSLCEFFNREENTLFSVEDLITYVLETPLQNMDIHVLPQWASCGMGRIPFKMIGKVENLQQDIKSIAEAGLIHKESVNHFEIHNSSGISVGNERAISLTRSQRSRIMNIYERDFEVFGF